MRKLYWGIALLVLLSPLGILAQGTAWGEWSSAEFKQMIGFVPSGMRLVETLWPAPLPEYALPGQQGGALLEYMLSGAIGVVIIFAAFQVFGRFLTAPEEESGNNEDS
jgi:hypothetical protein